MSNEIALSNRGVVRPTTMTEMIQFANLVSKSTFAPIAYRNKPEDTFIAIQMGAELGLSPMQSLQSIAVINGRPSLFGDAMLALIKASPLCDDVIEVIKGEGENQTAVCEARRKGKEPVIRGFSIHDAKKAKLWGKAGPWSDYPIVMLKHRARGFALRDAFPDLLKGLISAEEAADIPRAMKDVTPPSTETVAAELDAFAAVGEAHPDEPVTYPEFDSNQAEAVLAQAHAKALEGTPAFRAWYVDAIDDAQRDAVKPHLRELQDTAREHTPAAVSNPRRKVPRKDDEPTEEQIARQQNMLEAVLGPDPDPAPIVEPPDYSVLVAFDPAAPIQDFRDRARKKLEGMGEMEAPAYRYTAFVKANLAGMLKLKLDLPSDHQQLQQLIAAGERR